MEHILIYILNKLYWILIYCFTVAGQVSLSDDMFCDSGQWVCEEVDSVADTVSSDTDIQNFSSVGMLCHSHSSKSLCLYYSFNQRVVWVADVLQRQLGCVPRGDIECPEKHRVRLRFCSD